MGNFSRTFEPFYRETSGDIFKFCRALNFNPSWQQKLLLQAVQDGHPRIAVRSGQGIGKTAASTVVGLWRSYRNLNALTIITAPTMRQCRDVWLVEARRQMERADPVLQRFIEITKSKVQIGRCPDWGVKTVTATKEENAQGYHEENMTVIVEEASGVERGIITQFKGTLSNPNSLLLMIGNPNVRDCAFFDCFNRQRHNWHCIAFNAEESPPEIVSPARNKALEEEFGRDSDVYRVRVLGEFPHSDPNTVISTEDLEKCVPVTGNNINMYRYVLSPREPEFGGGRVQQLGIDLARFGGDESTIFRRSGNAIVEWRHFAHTDPSIVIDHAFKMQADCGWRDKDTWYVADAGGMGQGIMHKFYQAGKNIMEFHNGGKAVDHQYENKITEGWFQLAKKVRKLNCYIPNDNQLIQQLCGRQYFTTKKGKLVLETKDDYMKRGNNSPDRADGLVYAFYDHAVGIGQTAAQGKGSRAVGVELR